MQLPDLKGVRIASEDLKDVSIVTPLTLNERLSEEFNSRIFLKREDLQKVRSFKIRGAFNKIKSVDFNNSKNFISKSLSQLLIILFIYNFLKLFYPL